MANRTADELYQAFLDAAGQQATETSGVQYVLEQAIAELNTAQQQAAQESIAAAKDAKTTQSQSGSSSGSDSGSGLLTVLKYGSGIGAAIGGLIDLFGGDSDTPPALVKYALPAAMNIDASQSGGQLQLTNYDQTGLARAAQSGPTAESSAAAGGAQVTVNVQAMDARSFLDRSGEIAAAVRDAMLNLNSINDVVNDL